MRAHIFPFKNVYNVRLGQKTPSFFIKEFTIEHSLPKDADMKREDEDDNPITSDTPSACEVKDTPMLGKRSSKSQEPSDTEKKSKKPIRFCITRH